MANSSFDLNAATQWFNQQIATQKAAQDAAFEQLSTNWGASRDQHNALYNQYTTAIYQGQALKQALNQITQASQLGVDPTNLTQFLDAYQNGGNTSQASKNLGDQITQQSQLNSQNQQLQQFDKNYQGQMFGTDANGNPLSLQQSLAGNSGTIGALNQFETGQTADTFNKLLSPEISMALGGQGLLNSGAQVELQSKALAGLQLAQQQNIMQAALGAQNQEQGLQQQAVLGNIAGQQGQVANTLNTNNAYMTMQFQQQLMDQQAQLAKQLASYGGGSQRGGLMGGLQGALGGAMAGMAIGGPYGAAAGAIGGGVAGGLSSQGVGSGIGGIGSALYGFSKPKTYNYGYNSSLPGSGYYGSMPGPSL